MKFSDSVTVIKSVGKQRSEKLKILGIYTVQDLIEHYPRDYEDRSIITEISQMEPDTVYTIKGTVYKECQTARIKSLIVTKCFIKDETGTMEIVWFNQGYLKNNFNIGDIFFFTGKVTEKSGRRQMISPDYEKEGANLLNTARIVPVYPSTYKITQKLLRAIISDAVEGLSESYRDIFSAGDREKYGICGKYYAVKNIHFPESREAFFQARKRLVFEEFFLLQLSLFSLKGISKKDGTDIIIENDCSKDIDFGYKLTGAQEKVIEEIKEDFKSGCAMYRLVQGDVGSGKTAVSIIAAYLAIKSGFQAAIMAPTEVLAAQHYESFRKILKPLGIHTVFLSGSMKKRERDFALDIIASGHAHMVVGTHALIQERVQFNNLGLVVTDEQHRFGVKQRTRLSDKGTKPHVLVMSATPIPRTLALVLYGDLDVSVINEMPPGRQKIETYAVDSTYRERIFSFIRKEIDKGRQAYIICSSIEEGEDEKIKSVMKYWEEIQNRYLKGYVTQCLHGKMAGPEKEYIMDLFSKGEINAIVSTTVVEVGVNVPNATIMLIENAERFGLSQLHQLRGRVGRGTEQSYCILISDAKGQIAKKRLKAMTDTNDGFEISELDLKLRGPGDFFGTRQHGLMELKIGNLYKDTEILSLAQEAAREVFHEFEQGNNEELMKVVENLTQKMISTIEF